LVGGEVDRTEKPQLDSFLADYFRKVLAIAKIYSGTRTERTIIEEASGARQPKMQGASQNGKSKGREAKTSVRDFRIDGWE